MSLPSGIFDFLSDNLTIGDRVYPLTLPQGVTLPALTYQQVSMVPTVTHDWQQDHPLYDGVRYEESRIQFNSYGDTFDDAVALSNELEATITGYRGPWGDVQIESVIPALTLDDLDPDVGMSRRVSDYYIGWKNSGS